MQSSDLHRPVGEMFTDDTFMAFVYDFYDSYGNNNDELPQVEEVYNAILWDDEMYREFLLFCKRNNFSFIEKTEIAAQRIALQLSVLEYLQGMVTDSVQDILQYSEEYICENMRNSRLQEKQWVNMWDALLASIKAGVPVNSYGEVVYMLEQTQSGFKVYSYETGVHEINMYGEVTYDRQKEISKKHLEARKQDNREKRVKVLKKIQRYQKFQILLESGMIDDERDRNMMQFIIREFEVKTGQAWKDVAWNTQEENIFALRLKSYVCFQILDLEKEYRRLQEEDNFAQQDITLVWGTDLGD